MSKPPPHTKFLAMPVQANLRLQHLDAHCKLDQTQSQPIELRNPTTRTAWHQRAQAPHHPIRADMQKQAHLVGGRATARRAIGGQMGLPSLDVVSACPRAQ